MVWKIGKALGSVLLAALLGWAALTAAYLLPEERMMENATSYHTLDYVFFNSEVKEYGMSIWVDDKTPGSAGDTFTDALMINTALYPAQQASWQDALLNLRYGMKDMEYLPKRQEYIEAERPEITLQKMTEGDLEGCIVKDYTRYWNGYLAWLKPALYAFSFSTVRLGNAALQILLAFWLFALLQEKIGKSYGWAFFLAYLLLNPVTIAMSFQYTPSYYLATLFSILLLYHEKWVAEGKTAYLLTASGIATAYFDFLTYPLFTYGLPMAIALLIAHRKGLLIKTFDGVKRVIEGGLFWLMAYGGMYISKWALATAFTDINVFADALTRLTYRMSHTQDEADFDLAFGFVDVFFRNLLAWIQTPAFTAFALFVMTFALLRIRKMIKKEERPSTRSVTLGLLLLCLSPFVWYDVMLNHSYLHYWFTFRELAIFAFAFASIMILRTEEK